ncbi:hypothetical protein Pcinc_022405 [Petrolisthes cinctipes]|uniref:Uncharacterized protein n=1 Tax=Petrolisthes cinctipes TaxID=88211 RepID=A0AAE1FEN8_PETCI|nr:hypothetical protein Pcinc_022405 [Petrolisthes cinctipes]
MTGRRVDSSSPSGFHREESIGSRGPQGDCPMVGALQEASQPHQPWRCINVVQVWLRLPSARIFKLLLPMIFYSIAVFVFAVQVPAVSSYPVSAEKSHFLFHVRFFPFIQVQQKKGINQGNSSQTFHVTPAKDLEQEQTKTKKPDKGKIQDIFPCTRTKNLKTNITQKATPTPQSIEKRKEKIQQIVPVAQTRESSQDKSQKENFIVNTRKLNQEKTQHAPPITGVPVLSFPLSATNSSNSSSISSRTSPTSSGVPRSYQTNNSWHNKFSESLPGGHDVGGGGGGGGGGGVGSGGGGDGVGSGGGSGSDGSVRVGRYGGSVDGVDAGIGCCRGWLDARRSKGSNKFAHVISHNRTLFERFRSLEQLKNLKSQRRILFASSDRREDVQNRQANTDYKCCTSARIAHTLLHHDTKRETIGFGGSGSEGAVFPVGTSGHLHTRGNKEMPTKRPTFSIKYSGKEDSRPVTRLGSPAPSIGAKFHWHSVSNFRDLSNQVSSPGSFTSTSIPTPTSISPSISSSLATSIFLLTSSTSLPTPFTSPLAPFTSFLSLITSPITSPSSPLTSSTSPLTSSRPVSSSTSRLTSSISPLNSSRPSSLPTSITTPLTSLRPITLPASPASAQKENFHLLQALRRRWRRRRRGRRRRRRRSKTDLKSIPERELIHIDNAAAARIDERADSNWKSGSGDEIRRRKGRKVVKSEEKTVTDSPKRMNEEDKQGARAEGRVKLKKGRKRVKKKRKTEAKRKGIKVKYGCLECKKEDTHRKKGEIMVRRKVNKMKKNIKIFKKYGMNVKTEEDENIARKDVRMKLEEKAHNKDENTMERGEKKRSIREGKIYVKREGKKVVKREGNQLMQTEEKKVTETETKAVTKREEKKVNKTEGELVKTEREKVQSEGRQVKNGPFYQDHSPQLVTQLSENKREAQAADATQQHQQQLQLLSRHKRKKAGITQHVYPFQPSVPSRVELLHTISKALLFPRVNIPVIAFPSRLVRSRYCLHLTHSRIFQ